MYTLRINNKVVDLQDNFDATLSYSTIDFINPLDRTGGYTYTITIPYTKNNNQIFNFVNDDIIIDKFKVEEFDAVLDFNQSTLVSGIFYLDSITQTGFRGQIVSDTLNWTKDIPSGNINVLSGFTVPFPQDISGEVPSIEETLFYYNNSATSENSNFVLPFITYGNYNYAQYGQAKNNIQANIGSPFLPFSAGTIFAIDDLFPCNFYVNSIRNLFSYMGYNVQCSLFNDDELKNKIIAGSNKDFKWNWGTLGTSSVVDSSIAIDYFKSLDESNVIVDSFFNPTLESGSHTYYGYRYVVRFTGELNIELTGVTNATNPTFIICQSDTDYTTLSLINKSSSNVSSYTVSAISVTTGDYIFVATEDFNDITDMRIYYPNEDVDLNYQKTLPQISCKDYLKNFINLYNLYPFFNPRNNTVFLYTLDEFVQSDRNFILNSVTDFDYSKYVNSSINLAYTYDPKDPLLTDKEFDFGDGNDVRIQFIFSPTKTRTFIVSDAEVGDSTGNGPYDLLSIASQEQINLDRLDLNLSDTVDYLPWNAVTEYAKGDLAEYNGLFFTSIQNVNSGNTPSVTTFEWWIQDFLGQYNTDKDFDYTPRLLEYIYDTNKISGYTEMINRGTFIQMFPKRLNPPDYFYLAFQTAEFSSDLDLTYIYNKHYAAYRGFVNNRTSLLTGRAYIPLPNFIQYFNIPYEITYLSDTYILLGITNYNPTTEIGTVSMIKKITLSNWQ
jgi:hypothetical protein